MQMILLLVVASGCMESSWTWLHHHSSFSCMALRMNLPCMNRASSIWIRSGGESSTIYPTSCDVVWQASNFDRDHHLLLRRRILRRCLQLHMMTVVWRVSNSDYDHRFCLRQRIKFLAYYFFLLILLQMLPQFSPSSFLFLLLLWDDAVSPTAAASLLLSLWLLDGAEAQPRIASSPLDVSSVWFLSFFFF